MVNTAASNKAPTNITLSKNAISEAASSLVIGTLTTADSDQTAGVKLTYALAEVTGQITRPSALTNQRVNCL